MSNIFITGATGHFGKATIDSLLKKGVAAGDILALIRDETKATELKEKGIRLIKGDYKNYDSLVKAFAGVDKLLFVSSGDIVDRVTQHDNVVKAAKKAGVKFVLYTSFERKTETEGSPIAFIGHSHLKTEQLLKESGLNHSIFRNNVYLDYIPFFIGNKVLETAMVYLPAGEGKGGYALRAEMAEAAANVLTSSGHEGKAYHISNVEKYSYADVAKTIGDITGKEIKYISPSVEEAIKTSTDAGVPKEFAEAAAAITSAHAQGEFDMTSADLETLLGRKPTSLKTYLQSVYSKS
jgi:NAD(P)H dehydrogenase (quinone)